MKRFIIFLPMILLAGCVRTSTYDTIKDPRKDSPAPRIRYTESESTGYVPLNYERQKAIWISYVDLAPMLAAENADDFRKLFKAACADISDLGCNTIFVHIRPFGDAVYTSELFPTSEYLCGNYDALEIICETAHDLKLSVHAWINPLRLQTAERLKSFAGYKTADWFLDGDDKVSYIDEDGHLWLDPAYPEVRELIAEGTYEIVSNYNVDGLHYDDYFYPTTDQLFDAECFAQMGCGRDLDEWRRENISVMCRGIYESVKNADSRCEVSISPQGNIENNYYKLYADVEKWCCETGICDRIIPQIYFGYDNAVKPFMRTLEEWRILCESGAVSLNIGLAVYKICEEKEYTENIGIIAHQIDDCKLCQGVSLYTYGSLFGDNRNDERIAAEREAIADALAKY